ncbi:MAG: TIGR04211 family SH3 domain-containing protein [Arenicellaceae bacterium]|nr:TIGR04211 family SH3 domain-containing protein [Arenicellaceae bacterium]
MPRAFAVFIISFLVSVQVFSETVYVSDVLRITVRTGPTTDNEILETVSSGTLLESTGEEADGWLPVRTAKGINGYAMSRFLVSEPIARDQLADMKAQLDSLQADPDSLRATMLRVQSENKSLSTQNDELSLEVQKMAESLSSITDLAVTSERDELREERDKLMLGLDEARIEQSILKDQSDKKWVMVGAGVLFVGIVLGLILPGLKSRRHSSWSS